MYSNRKKTIRQNTERLQEYYACSDDTDTMTLIHLNAVYKLINLKSTTEAITHTHTHMYTHTNTHMYTHTHRNRTKDCVQIVVELTHILYTQGPQGWGLLDTIPHRLLPIFRLL
eukprot:GHVR01001249.1.p1 GENE.GHVR01001249.1~~GHVR01001249.1.p1  ORF type:complete len:114 (-),score=41.13 GHVR01001249.1:245-586(-)